MYEEVSRAPNHFSVVLFLRRCKSTAENKAKQCFSHNFPEKPPILGKIGLFLGKIKGQLSQHRKTKEKSQNINKKPIKHPYFTASLFPKNCCFWEKSEVSWEKSRHYWEKSHVSWENGNLVNNIVNAPLALKGAEAPSPGQSPWVNQQSAMRPIR